MDLLSLVERIKDGGEGVRKLSKQQQLGGGGGDESQGQRIKKCDDRRKD